MSVVTRTYVTMARRAFQAAAVAVPDREIVLGVGPVLETLEALDLHASGGRELTVDSRSDSGLPLFSKVAAVHVDAGTVASPEGARQIEEAKSAFTRNVAEAVNTIILDKRRPSPVVEGQMKRAEYVLFLAAMRGAHGGMVTPALFAEDVFGEEEGFGRRQVVTWTFWDMTVSAPVRFWLHLAASVPQEQDRAFAEAMQRTTRLFNGLSFPLAAVAAEIDQKVPGAAIASLSRVVYGPLFSRVFMNGDHPLLAAMGAMNCGVGDYALEIRREDVTHDGEFVARGIFNKTYDRVFTVDASRQDCVTAGARRIVRHLVAPHAVVQSVSDDPSLTAFLADRRLYAEPEVETGEAA